MVIRIALTFSLPEVFVRVAVITHFVLVMGQRHVLWLSGILGGHKHKFVRLASGWLDLVASVLAAILFLAQEATRVD